ncbi:MAG TPA: hypothetical protein PL151_07845 [Phycisphaerae bacterium]|nr:hypothetical protein [Phycisphaerae bacterium]HOJ73141.1 hypothetical protein [Phycisphaerae bacterium]HOM52206.1 hypothetical protein [Phycisphaerae bacterium]HON68844.1 hypothetical protein [Phycisphaerae bacterium]HOQ85223.1 hypothetical protein [Phycisphaerae bacterium]
MSWIRRNLFKILFVLTLFALPGADIECEDDEFEFNWPSFRRNYWIAEPVYYVPVYEPCCWFW